MLRTITLITLYLLSILAQAQQAEQRTLAPYSKIDVSRQITLLYTPSNTASLSVKGASATDLSDIITEVRDNTLFVTRKSNDNSPVQVKLNGKGITALRISDHGIVKFTSQVYANDFLLQLSGGSVFNGDLKAETVRITAETRSVCTGTIVARGFFSNFESGSWSRLRGNSDTAMVSTASGATCNHQAFQIRKAILEANGASTIQAKVSDVLDISLDETSRVNYYGEPRTTSHSKNIHRLERYVSN